MFIIGMSGPKRSGKDFGAVVLSDLLSRHGYPVYTTSFALALRQLTYVVTGCTVDDVDRYKDQTRRFNFSIQNLYMGLRQMGCGPKGDTATDVGCWQNMWSLAIEAELMQQARNAKVPMKWQDAADFDGLELTCTGRDILIIIGQAARRVDPDFWVRRAAENIHQTCGEWDNGFVILTDVRPQNEARACDFVIEVTADHAQFEGTATESRLPEHLRHVSIHNTMNKGYGNSLRLLVPRLVQLMQGKQGDTPAMQARQQWLSPELFNRAFLEVR